jgi:hypothetical protein
VQNISLRSVVKAIPHLPKRGIYILRPALTATFSVRKRSFLGW